MLKYPIQQKFGMLEYPIQQRGWYAEIPNSTKVLVCWNTQFSTRRMLIYPVQHKHRCAKVRNSTPVLICWKSQLITTTRKWNTRFSSSTGMLKLPIQRKYCYADCAYANQSNCYSICTDQITHWKTCCLAGLWMCGSWPAHNTFLTGKLLSRNPPFTPSALTVAYVYQTYKFYSTLSAPHRPGITVIVDWA